MKKIFTRVVKLFFMVLMAALIFTPAVLAVQRFENEDIAVTAKLPPQYLGWKVVEGDTTETVPFYYKVSAYVTGIGETQASDVTTAYATYSPTSSTNSLRLMWASVNGATEYYLYKSIDNSSFYLLATVSALTYVDAGAALGAAYAGPTLRGGNITIDMDLRATRNIHARDMIVTFGLHAATITASSIGGFAGVNVSSNATIGGAVTIADNLKVSSTVSVGLSILGGRDINATRNVNGRDGIFTFGVAAATGVFSGVFNIQGAATLDSTLDVDGNEYHGAANYRSTFTAASGALALTGALSGESTLDIDGNVYQGAANYRSTFTASSGNLDVSGRLATLTTLSAVGATNLDSTLDVDGNEYHGAANYRSTFTAASGATAFSGAITSLAGFSGTTGTFSGDVKRGAANYVSTFTATTGAEIMTGAFTSLASVTAPNIIATAIARIPSLALATIMAKTAVMGDIFICNDCSPVEVAISTAAGAPNTGGYANAVGLQLD